MWLNNTKLLVVVLVQSGVQSKSNSRAWFFVNISYDLKKILKLNPKYQRSDTIFWIHDLSYINCQFDHHKKSETPWRYLPTNEPGLCNFYSVRCPDIPPQVVVDWKSQNVEQRSAQVSLPENHQERINIDKEDKHLCRLFAMVEETPFLFLSAWNCH